MGSPRIACADPDRLLEREGERRADRGRRPAIEAIALAENQNQARSTQPASGGSSTARSRVLPASPFGGYKQSGFGRELSLETKSVLVHTGAREQCVPALTGSRRSHRAQRFHRCASCCS